MNQIMLLQTPDNWKQYGHSLTKISHILLKKIMYCLKTINTTASIEKLYQILSRSDVPEKNKRKPIVIADYRIKLGSID